MVNVPREDSLDCYDTIYILSSKCCRSSSTMPACVWVCMHACIWKREEWGMKTRKRSERWKNEYVAAIVWSYLDEHTHKHISAHSRTHLCVWAWYTPAIIVQNAPGAVNITATTKKLQTNEPRIRYHLCFRINGCCRSSFHPPKKSAYLADAGAKGL